MTAIFKMQYAFKPDAILFFLFFFTTHRHCCLLKNSSLLLLKQVPTFTSREASALNGVGLGRAVGGGMTGLRVLDSAIMGRPQSTGPELSPNGRDIGFGGQPSVDKIARPDHRTEPLPPGASNTLYVEGFPPDSTRREVSRILLMLQ